MKVWIWFAIAALWLTVVIAVTFSTGKFDGFGVEIRTGNWLPMKVWVALVAFLFYLILLGWLIPFSIGILQLVRAKLVR